MTSQLWVLEWTRILVPLFPHRQIEQNNSINTQGFHKDSMKWVYIYIYKNSLENAWSSVSGESTRRLLLLGIMLVIWTMPDNVSDNLTGSAHIFHIVCLEAINRMKNHANSILLQCCLLPLFCIKLSLHLCRLLPLPWLHIICLFFYKVSTKQGFPGGADGKVSACNAGDLGSVPGWGRSPGEGHGNPLQYSRLENPWTEENGGLQSMGSQSRMWLSDFTFTEQCSGCSAWHSA